MILGTDFIADAAMRLDIRAGGYYLGDDPSFFPFETSAGPPLPCRPHAALPTESLPADLLQELPNFKGTSFQRRQLEAFLCQYADMFTEKPGETDVLQHRIDTGDAKPWRCSPRPMYAPKRALFDKALNEKLDTAVIRPSKSPWAFPVVPAGKKDGSMRICVEFRKLNAMTE
ncbi:uncharacterized protein LOC144180206 [Haemaphysalis longicornis]